MKDQTCEDHETLIDIMNLLRTWNVAQESRLCDVFHPHLPKLQQALGYLPSEPVGPTPIVLS